jgi:uncharacterized Zn finger protein (UPF0148 family)
MTKPDPAVERCPHTHKALYTNKDGTVFCMACAATEEDDYDEDVESLLCALLNQAADEVENED